MRLRRALFAFLMVATLLLPGCLGIGDSDEVTHFPEFSGVTDSGVTYSSDNLSGTAYVVLFSAEWCGTPCYSVMHHINSVLNGTTVVIMSTDPNTDITLQEWHRSANEYDDEGDDEGVSLPFQFMKGIQPSLDLDIEARPTIIFVKSDHLISDTHKGTFDDDQQLDDLFAEAEA